MAVIERSRAGRYGAPMRTLTLKILALLALLAMPYVMAAAPAQAHSAPAGHEQAMEHCTDATQRHENVPTGTAADCAMPCSAALPAGELSPIAAGPLPRPSIRPNVVSSLAGTELEIATPPPRDA